MTTKRFSNQTGEQVVSHLKRFLRADQFNVEIDTFAGVAEVRRAFGCGGESKKKDRIRDQIGGMRPKRRRDALSNKRREKPKLKHVRNGRAITLKGYTGFQ